MYKKRNILLFAVAIIFAALFWKAPELKSAGSPPALSGVVSSDAVGPMEGVLVSAKRTGGNIRVTVVSDHNGRYEFPANRLSPGQYNISLRAVGYDPTLPDEVVTLGSKSARLDIKLEKTRDLASQLSSAEWLTSAPGTQEDKDELYKCVLCHTATPIVSSKYDARGWLATISRMRNYGPASEFDKPQILPFHQLNHPGDAAYAKYLSTINLSSKSQWDFPLKTLPRPSGAATKVIITEYDLPRSDAQPHDAVIDSQGMIWYDDFAEPILGRLDPRTGKTQEWTLPEIRPNFPSGSLDLELDREGNPWIARLLQAGIAKFDTKTEKITSWILPQQYTNPKSRVPFLAFGSDGLVWYVDTWNRTMYLLNPATGHLDRYPGVPRLGCSGRRYGLGRPGKGNSRALYIRN